MEQRIRRDLAFLFEEHGATVRSNTVDSFGFSQILITAGNVEFRFTYLKREDDCQLAVGPSDGHGVWELPHVALAAATGESTEALFVPLSCGDHPGNPSDLGFTGVASVLKPRFAELNKAFAPENYPATQSRMADIERAVHRR
ncbi:MAG TPA: hypothetical protein VGF88_02370 [Acidobacteriaceae bacterium]|jgi:hypothetical protein